MRRPRLPKSLRKPNAMLTNSRYGSRPFKSKERRSPNAKNKKLLSCSRKLSRKRLQPNKRSNVWSKKSLMLSVKRSSLKRNGSSRSKSRRS